MSLYSTSSKYLKNASFHLINNFQISTNLNKIEELSNLKCDQIIKMDLLQSNDNITDELISSISLCFIELEKISSSKSKYYLAKYHAEANNIMLAKEYLLDSYNTKPHIKTYSKLASCYMSGNRFDIDHDLSRQLFYKAANLNEPIALYNVCQFYYPKNNNNKN